MLEELKKVREALESAAIGVDYTHIALAEPAKRNPVCASLRAWTGGSKRDLEKALALLSGVIERLERDGTVIKRYLIVKNPGEVPFIKKPMGNSYKATLKMMREMISLPEYDESEIIIAKLTHDLDLWVSSAREELHLHDEIAKAALDAVRGK